jgi:transcriptional regulator with XRE-family HTH domain
MPSKNQAATGTDVKKRKDPAGATSETVTFGQRLRRYRTESGMSLTALAEAAGVSKGYLSSLESDEHQRRPSAEVLYALAQQLGVTMSDLMGRKLLPAASPEIPDSLAAFAEEAKLNEADTAMLASIRFRGEQPRTAERWRYIYDSIRNSTQMDKS